MAEETTDLDKVLDKIQKLFNLGESPNEAEASAAIAKAHDLMKQYHLSSDAVEARARGKGQTVEQAVYMDGKHIRLWKKLLMSTVCSTNFCALLTHTRITKFKNSKVKNVDLIIVGKSSNVIIVKAMIDYLLGVIDRLAKKPGIKGEGKSFIESYKIGLAEGLILKLQALKKKDLVEDESRALVIQEAKDVDDFLEKNDVKEPDPVDAPKKKDYWAWRQGREDAQGVSLNSQLESEETPPKEEITN